MVSAAFVTHKGKLLLFHRDDVPTIKDPDCWDIIGGHLEEGETPEQGLIREVKEEISIDIEDPIFLKELPDYWGGKTYLYHVELDEKQVTEIKLGDEGKEVKFFTRQDMNNLKLTHNLALYLEDHLLQVLDPSASLGMTG